MSTYLLYFKKYKGKFMFTFNLLNFDIKSILGINKYEVPEKNKPSDIKAFKELYVMCHNYIAAFANIIDKILQNPENGQVNCKEEFDIIFYEKDCIWNLFGYEHKLFNEARYENCKNEFITYFENFETVYKAAQGHVPFTDEEAAKILKSLKVSCDALWKLETMIKDQ